MAVQQDMAEELFQEKMLQKLIDPHHIWQDALQKILLQTVMQKDAKFNLLIA